MTEQQLFALPTPAPLVLPAVTGVGSGPVRWAKYTAKNPVKCDLCMRVAYEAGQRGQGAPVARQARQRRTQGDSCLLVCNEHAALLKEQEATPTQRRNAV